MPAHRAAGAPRRRGARPDRLAPEPADRAGARRCQRGRSRPVGIEVARALLDRLGELVDVDPAARPVDPATVLHAVLGRRPDGSPEAIAEPLIPLLDTTLLTNAPGEPRCGASCGRRSSRPIASTS